MIGWVDSLCKDWARHKRRIIRVTSVSLPSTLGHAQMQTQYKRGKRTGRDPIRSVATRSTPKRDFPEVFSETALHIARAIEGMPAEKRAVMTVHYLYGVPPHRRLELVRELNGKSLSLRSYWRRLHGVHCWIAANLP